ncbi:XRN 5'-3' exonuclease N-terminus-domain-containing protein [Radiomyces spectabilis]|uniref:XRN 5'-3' exonuclease N-terminus-domain-containing protein n=1 Tax=Radiomyces spectabilis TaxID=64574 RepID=UPI00222086A5|nr:XRN 5'-3' exonuclease N-terminus-domain-containing protein [Radiomyces spectabilis]KAI8367638.1 XRN 5'-3' exonuclease N-terminus-domain-containing protein [Radiomyces spectabilis]
MGVPAFFRWLSDKFPKCASQVIEEQATVVNGVVIPVDTTKPNPNGEEFDNLYLDMNGIIHPCCHPENKPAPETEDDMMIEIFEYLDRIVDIVRPRKVLYMAIDGVAPRAKMNQQRSRRFRAAQLAQAEREAVDKVHQELAAIGQEHQLPEKKAHFDSNCITPGTGFMDHLATCLRYHIAAKQNSDPLWKDLKVVLSDATVPGEGEHKVMEYIRVQRSRPEHQPNTSHVIYGLDADLIMLALGTHEPHFKILREDVFFNQGSKKNCFVCNKPGHSAAQCTANARSSAAAAGEAPPPMSEEEKKSELKPYVFLHVNILREYLEHALKFNVPGIPWDLERAIDDWVFLCFFVGNDFLPHLPSLEIREGAISTLSILWKQCMPMMGGYMTHNGEVDLQRVQILVTELGKMENQIFQDRRDKEERRSRNQKRRKLETERRKAQFEQGVPAGAPSFAEMTAAPVNDPSAGMTNSEIVANRASLRMANEQAASALKAQLLGATSSEPTSSEAPEQVDTSMSDATVTSGHKRKADEAEIDDEDTDQVNEDDDDAPDTAEGTDLEAAGKAILDRVAADKKAHDDAAREREPDDAVRLWESGWKERYYKMKFHIPLEDRDAIQDIVKSYCEGLCWVFKYYYTGCASWSWYYPYYYAPMASDFVNIDAFDIKFDLSAPLRPFEQLMGVLPPASRDHIPTAFHHLMIDDNSPILDFYPTEFEVDMDGKKWEWQGVVKLPFIDTGRLLEAMATVYDQLSDEEQHRNSAGPSILYVSENHKLYNYVSTVYTKRSTEEQMPLDPRLSDGMTGSVDRDPECIPRSTLRSPLPNHDLSDIANDKSISVEYFLPQNPEGYVYSTALLRGVKLDEPALNYKDLQYATFEKIEHNRHQENRGWVPQLQHLEEYREYNNRIYRGRYNHNRGNYDGGYNDRGGYQGGGYNEGYNGGGYRGGYRGGHGGYGGYDDGSRYPQQGYYNHNAPPRRGGGPRGGGYQGGGPRYGGSQQWGYNQQQPYGGYDGGYRGGSNGPRRGGYRGGGGGGGGGYQQGNNGRGGGYQQRRGGRGYQPYY